jgi:hypothetical protein
MVPPWVSLMFGALVLVWGAYRIKLGLRSKAAEERALERKGLFGMPRRTHILIGVVYVLLGGGMIAIGLGWTPIDFTFQ